MNRTKKVSRCDQQRPEDQANLCDESSIYLDPEQGPLILTPAQWERRLRESFEVELTQAEVNHLSMRWF